jgi:hypothetical protein
LIRYDALVKTKLPGFQQLYLNKTPQDYGRLARWIQELLQAIDRESFPTLVGPATPVSFVLAAGACSRRHPFSHFPIPKLNFSEALHTADGPP